MAVGESIELSLLTEERVVGRGNEIDRFHLRGQSPYRRGDLRLDARMGERQSREALRQRRRFGEKPERRDPELLRRRTILPLLVEFLSGLQPRPAEFLFGRRGLPPQGRTRENSE